MMTAARGGAIALSREEEAAMPWDIERNGAVAEASVGRGERDGEA